MTDTKIKLNFKKKTKDYSYAVLFFVIFSFFIVAVIKPNVTAVFELQKEKERLMVVRNSYSAVIDKIVDIQSTFENIRLDAPIINEALPVGAQINKVIKDIDAAASSSGVLINRFNIDELNFKKEKNTVTNNLKAAVDLEVIGDFEQIKNFTGVLLKQRRLKTVDDILITRENEKGTDSASLKAIIKLSTKYL